jgi:hypothetical protein
MTIRSILVVLTLAFSTLILAGPAMAIEQPIFALVHKERDYEIRRYQPYIVAEVVANGDQGQAVQQGFRKLAGYIFGANAGKAKIAMTAPVAQRPEGEKIAMTSPVRKRRWGQSAGRCSS